MLAKHEKKHNLEVWGFGLKPLNIEYSISRMDQLCPSVLMIHCTNAGATPPCLMTKELTINSNTTPFEE